MLGPESGDFTGMSFVEEHRDVVITRKDLVGTTLRELKEKIDPSHRRGVYAVRLSRVDNQIKMRPGTHLQSGDVITLVGPADQMQSAADDIGYMIEPSNKVDYVYLGLGIIAGILLGMITVPIAGSPISLGIGGGCLISGWSSAGCVPSTRHSEVCRQQPHCICGISGWPYSSPASDWRPDRRRSP